MCLPRASAPGHCVFNCSAENLNMNLSSLRLRGGRLGHWRYSYFSKPNAQIQALKCNAGWEEEHIYIFTAEFSGEGKSRCVVWLSGLCVGSSCFVIFCALRDHLREHTQQLNTCLPTLLGVPSLRICAKLQGGFSRRVRLMP